MRLEGSEKCCVLSIREMCGKRVRSLKNVNPMFTYLPVKLQRHRVTESEKIALEQELLSDCLRQVYYLVFGEEKLEIAFQISKKLHRIECYEDTLKEVFDRNKHISKGFDICKLRCFGEVCWTNEIFVSIFWISTYISPMFCDAL